MIEIDVSYITMFDLYQQFKTHLFGLPGGAGFKIFRREDEVVNAEYAPLFLPLFSMLIPEQRQTATQNC